MQYFFWQLLNKTADFFNNSAFILVMKISSQKVCEKMDSTLEKILQVCNRNAVLLRLVGLSQKDEGEKFVISKKFIAILVSHFLFYLFVVVDIWVVKY